MLIGLMSDSHDNIEGIKEALEIFSRRHVQMVMHAGDMVGSGNCYIFESYGMKLKLVYGNNDGDRVGLKRDFERAGGEYLGDFGEIDIEGRKIAMLHGTDEPLVKAIVSSQLYDVVIRGHNHRAEVTLHGKTLLVNPGEVWGHFTGVRSIAIMDTSSLKTEIVEMGRCLSFRELLKR